MKKVLHIGSYNINIGDNIALYNVRSSFEKELGEINWLSCNFDQFRKEEEALFFFKECDFDFIVVGGGGLLEPDSGFSSCKLPFTDKIFDQIDCPVFFMSIGINLFDGHTKINSKFKDQLSGLIERSSYFSLRDDGSAKQVQDLVNLGIESLPDSGFIISDIIEDKDKDISCVFQPATNSNVEINKNRFPNNSDVFLSLWVLENKLKVLPHSPKDLMSTVFDYVVPRNNEYMSKFCHFDNTIDSISIYKRLKSAIVMRGHGQILATAIGVPCISLSSQPKVRDYCILNGFEDYMVETKDAFLKEKLNNMYRKITSDADFINNWNRIREVYMKKSKAKFSKAIQTCISKL